MAGVTDVSTLLIAGGCETPQRVAVITGPHSKGVSFASRVICAADCWSSNVYVCVCVPRASSLKRRFRPYRGTCTLVLPEGGGPFVRTGRQRARQSGSARTSRVIWNSQKPTLLVSVGQKSTVSVGQRCQRLRVVDLVARVATCQPQRLVDLVAVNERRPALCTAHRCEGNQHPGV